MAENDGIIRYFNDDGDLCELAPDGTITVIWRRMPAGITHDPPGFEPAPPNVAVGNFGSREGDR